jgi:hypothetical protein
MSREYNSKEADEMKALRFTVLLACALLLGRAPCADEKKDPREDTGTAVAEAIRLLEAKDFKKFIQNFMPPEKLKQITDGKPEMLDQMAKATTSEGIAPVLSALKEIKDAKPELDAEGKHAKFALKEEIAGHKSMTFVKVDKFWYLDD